MMKKLARATFEITNWDEKPYGEMEGSSKLTRASVTKVYKGDMEGEGMLEYLMAYGYDGSASFVGIERFIGRIGGKRGNFAFQHAGTFKDGVAKSTWSVVPASGTGDLKALRGEVNSAIGHAKDYPVEFNYELE
jgi:hypothetical protein